MKKWVLIICIMLAMARPALAANVNYYVDCSATSGDGTTTATNGANAAWKDMTDIDWAGSIATSVAGGDTVYVNLNRGCKWDIQTMTVATSGASGRPITIQAYGTGARPNIDAGDVLGTALSLTLATGVATYVTIKDLDLEGGTKRVVLIGNTAGTSYNIIIDNVLIHDPVENQGQAKGHCLKVIGSNVTVKNSEIYNCEKIGRAHV